MCRQTHKYVCIVEEKQLTWWRYMKRMNENMPVKNIWKARIQKKTGKERYRNDWNGIVTKIMLKREKIIAR